MFKAKDRDRRTSRQRAGSRAEQQALRYLIDCGLEHVESNYRCRLGEVDLVMRDADQLVFVEVRYRRRLDFGGAAASVDAVKQRKLRAAAQHYLQSRHGGDKFPCRFDVVTFNGETGENHAHWIKNAF